MADILHGKAWDTGETLVVLGGADVLAWLQGQVTQNVRKCLEERSAGACFCSVNGPIEAIAMLHAMDGERIGVSTTRPEVVHSRLEQYVILEDVEGVGTMGPVLHSLDDPPASATWCGPSERLGRWGWDFVAPPGLVPTLGEAEANLFTLEHGIPQFGVDTDSKTLPVEFGTCFEESYVAYDKGCYVGQEVIMRAHTRGSVPRQWCCLRTEQALPPGTQLENPNRQVVGRVTRSALSLEYGHLAAASVRGAWAEASTRLRTKEGGAEVEVVRFPRRPSR